MEKLKHYEEIINNIISYLWEIWNNESLDDIEKMFIDNFGFTKEDMKNFYIQQEIEYLKQEIEYLK